MSFFAASPNHPLGLTLRPIPLHLKYRPNMQWEDKNRVVFSNMQGGEGYV